MIGQGLNYRAPIGPYNRSSIRLTMRKSAAENYLIWIEKEKTSERNLEFIWLGIEQINSKWINIYTKEELLYHHWAKDWV